MTTSRLAKPFIVAGLTGALAIAAPVAAFAAEPPAPATDADSAAAASPRISGQINYHIDQSTVYHEPLPDASEDGLDVAYGRMGVSGITYDLSFGLGSCRLNLYVPDRINDAASNVAYTGLTVTSSDDSVVRASIDKQKGLALLEFVGSGAAEVKIVGNFTIDGVAATTTRTVTVTVTGALPGGGEQGGGQGGQATEEQPTDEQKPTDSTDKKDADGKDQDAQNQDSDDTLPETGDPALLAVGMSGLAGAGTLGVVAVLRRRPR